MYCNLQQQVCQDCTQDNHCAYNDVCDTNRGECVECVDDNDCVGNGNRCIPDPGRSGAMTCGQCQSDADCSNGLRCHPTTGWCEPQSELCNTNADCGAGRTCDTSRALCVNTTSDNCVNDSDCLPTHQCVNNLLLGRVCEGCNFLTSPCPRGQVCIFVPDFENFLLFYCAAEGQ
jgi:Cys-rich repeat protein